METFATHESAVRSYCRRFNGIFTRAEGSKIYTDDGAEYIDFLLGAGSLNYGHNPPALTAAIADYLRSGGPLQTLDLHSEAKREFIGAFVDNILAPRSLDYRLQFTGPTGTNAVEAAIKLARKVTNRRDVVAFTGAFHGMTMGSQSLSAQPWRSPVARSAVIRMPYDGFLGPEVDTLDYIDAMLGRPGSGIEAPAAFIVETVQGEGGLNAASFVWLKRLAAVARRLGALLIVDDIQAGCGRTGSFFSFTPAQIVPDIVCLSKSLSGSGLPLSVVLLRPDLDVWESGEHNGTFRGNSLAFVTGARACRWWKGTELKASIDKHASTIRAFLDQIVADNEVALARVGRGLMQGLRMKDGFAVKVSEAAYERGLIVETAGPNDEVLKLFPALNIRTETLQRGLAIAAESLKSVLKCGDAAIRVAI